jgi:hypothetical protein
MRQNQGIQKKRSNLFFELTFVEIKSELIGGNMRDTNRILTCIQDLNPPLHVNILDYDCFVLAASQTVIALAFAPSQSLTGAKVSDGSGQGLLDWPGFEASFRAQLGRFMQVNVLSKAHLCCVRCLFRSVPLLYI